MSSAARRFRRQPNRARLIPVPALATDQAPTIADLRKTAVHLLARNQDELRTNPGLVAMHDQMRAAERAAMPGLRLLGERLGVKERTVEPSVDATAIGLGLYIASMRHVEAHCSHVAWPPTPSNPPTNVGLTARTATCTRPACNVLALARVHDDGLCELCERAAEDNYFYGYVVPLGPLVITIEVCSQCEELFRAGGARGAEAPSSSPHPRSTRCATRPRLPVTHKRKAPSER